MSLSGGPYRQESGLYTFLLRFERQCANGEKIVQELACVKHFATRDQIHGWFQQAGCTVEDEYGDYDRHPIDGTTSRAIIWAKKREPLT